jgi:hypothetical protein
MARYEFVSTWCLDAPVDQVWDAIFDAERWPEWWKGVVYAHKLRDGDEKDVGCIWRLGWRAKLPYTLEFESETTRVDRPRVMEGVTRGELNGVGIWRFYEGDAGTAAVYEWTVRTTKPWMNALAPVARAVFAHNHDVIMRQGAEGLARLLDKRLVVSS